MGQCERFWERIITGDETWCFAYDPATKRQSAEWVGQNSAKPKTLRFQKSRVKTMLTLRRLMSYIYGAPILDVSRSHTTTQHSR